MSPAASAHPPARPPASSANQSPGRSLKLSDWRLAAGSWLKLLRRRALWLASGQIGRRRQRSGWRSRRRSTFACESSLASSRLLLLAPLALPPPPPPPLSSWLKLDFGSLAGADFIVSPLGRGGRALVGVAQRALLCASQPATPFWSRWRARARSAPPPAIVERRSRAACRAGDTFSARPHSSRQGAWTACAGKLPFVCLASWQAGELASSRLARPHRRAPSCFKTQQNCAFLPSMRQAGRNICHAHDKGRASGTNVIHCACLPAFAPFCLNTPAKFQQATIMFPLVFVSHARPRRRQARFWPDERGR